jgi:hypothetical protein
MDYRFVDGLFSFILTNRVAETGLITRSGFPRFPVLNFPQLHFIPVSRALSYWPVYVQSVQSFT